jgi:chromosomal replication initiation ATPase DnaA
VGGWKGLKERLDSGERVRADERILGRSEFVERALRESEEERERKSLLRKRGMNLRGLVEKVAGHFGVDTESLKSGSKVPTIAKARAVVCYLGVRKIGQTSVSIATELGISQSAVSRAIAHAPEVLQWEELTGEWREYQ